MTPLFKKLGLKSDQRVYVLNYSGDYFKLFEELPDAIHFLERKPKHAVDFVHLFVNNLAELERFYFVARDAISKHGMVWISWPKGNKLVDINRDVIREYGLANGLVDVKVASINDFWSGLKFVYRLKDR